MPVCDGGADGGDDVEANDELDDEGLHVRTFCVGEEPVPSP